MDQSVLHNLVYKSMTGDFREDVKPYFNDIETFLKFVLKHDGFKFITDVAYGYSPEVSKNTPYGFWDVLSELKPEETLQLISEVFFIDVEYEGNDFFYVFDKYQDLANFFTNYDKEIINDIINNKPIEKSTLFELINDYNYDDFINGLSFENKLILGDYIIDKVGNQELFLDDFQSVVFKDISFKQKNQDTFIISEKNIMDIIEDPDGLKIILEKFAPEIIDKIYDIAIIATKNILYSDSFELILSSLSEIFEGDIFENNGELNLKIRNFKSLLGNNLSSFLYGTMRLPSFYKDHYVGTYIQDTPDFDFMIIDEINDIFENNLI